MTNLDGQEVKEAHAALFAHSHFLRCTACSKVTSAMFQNAFPEQATLDVFSPPLFFVHFSLFQTRDIFLCSLRSLKCELLQFSAILRNDAKTSANCAECFTSSNQFSPFSSAENRRTSFDLSEKDICSKRPVLR